MVDEGIEDVAAGVLEGDFEADEEEDELVKDVLEATEEVLLLLLGLELELLRVEVLLLLLLTALDGVTEVTVYEEFQTYVDVQGVGVGVEGGNV